MISYDQFKEMDIRIGTIERAEEIEGADKLLKFTINLGDHTRQILAGIAEYIEDPQELIGVQVPILANLEPRVIKGEESQGMMLAVDVDGKPVLLNPAEKVPSGRCVC